MGEGREEGYCISNIVHLSMEAFKLQVSPSTFDIVPKQVTRPFDVSPFGSWGGSRRYKHTGEFHGCHGNAQGPDRTRSGE